MNARVPALARLALVFAGCLDYSHASTDASSVLAVDLGHARDAAPNDAAQSTPVDLADADASPVIATGLHGTATSNVNMNSELAVALPADGADGDLVVLSIWSTSSTITPPSHFTPWGTCTAMTGARGVLTYLFGSFTRGTGQTSYSVSLGTSSASAGAIAIDYSGVGTIDSTDWIAESPLVLRGQVENLGAYDTVGSSFTTVSTIPLASLDGQQPTQLCYELVALRPAM